jgi:signal transduction histidine kinase
VADTGCGLDEKTKARIFEPFFTTKAVGQGTGLGLSVAVGILRSWNGAITVQSAPGQGATFDLYIPVAKDAPGT